MFTGLKVYYYFFFYSEHFNKPNFESVILLKIAIVLGFGIFYKVLVIPHFSEAGVFYSNYNSTTIENDTGCCCFLPFGFTFVIFMVIIITEIVCFFKLFLLGISHKHSSYDILAYIIKG